MKRRMLKQKSLLTYFIPLLFIFIFIFSIAVISSISKNCEENEISYYIKKKEFIIFDENFYEEEKADITYRWLSGSATITLVIPYDQVIKLHFISWSYNIPRDVKIYLNDFLLTELNLTPNREEYSSPFIYLKKGTHKLRFIVSGECQFPALIEGSGDIRCLSIGLGDFKKEEIYNLMLKIDSPGWYDIENYYGKDMRWMSEVGTINLINLEKSDFVLEFFAFSFYKDREVRLYVDENLIKTFKVTTNGSTENIKISLNPGLHKIRFVADGCDFPSKLGISDDPRCLSIAVVRPIIYE
jgi:hypothetical protein